ncbi:galactokinase [Treponema sp.]|uniref:galactokinase n=1 Tax=Treponema sp. TaxID=166 RepID=UPI003890DF26
MGLTDKEYDYWELPAAFVKMYGGNKEDVRVYASPARINIIGEHIDYNGGKVFPASIDRYLYVAIRKRADSKIIYNDVRFPGTYEFDINDNFAYDKKNDYANYLNGILSQLKEKGYSLPCGFEILMVSNVPAGGGISSSSALECGFAYAVSDTFNLNIDRVEIAKLGQMSEHNFMGVNCGIMDQFIIATGKKNTAEMLDCATLDYEYAPLDLGDYRFVVMNTNKVRKLSDSKYNERRSQCEQALKILQNNGVKINALCELSSEKWEEVKHFVSDEVLQKRAKHCVYENERVLNAVKALKTGDLSELGRLLNASHKSLKEDYEVTGIELDTLAETSQKQEGCLGSRMTGAGFGGCAIALVRNDKVEPFIENVQKEYTKKAGYCAGFFACETGDGVFRIL